MDAADQLDLLAVIAVAGVAAAVVAATATVAVVAAEVAAVVVGVAAVAVVREVDWLVDGHYWRRTNPGVRYLEKPYRLATLTLCCSNICRRYSSCFSWNLASRSCFSLLNC